MTSSWFFLSTLNYDARPTTHQISMCVYTVANFTSAYRVLNRCGYVTCRHNPTISFKALEKREICVTNNKHWNLCSVWTLRVIKAADWRATAPTEGWSTPCVRRPRCQVYPVPQGAGGTIQGNPPPHSPATTPMPFNGTALTLWRLTTPIVVVPHR